MDKLKQIASLLDGKNSYLSLEYSNGKWYLECWTDYKVRMLHDGFIEDLNKALDEIIEKLGGGING